MISEWLLTETNQKRLKRNLPEVAVIPTSAIEPHNLHLPIGQDFLHTSIITERSVEKAWRKTRKVIALPALPYGVDINLMDFPMAIHVSQKVLDAILFDIISSLLHYNIKKIVILNGHGGNDFAPFIRQTQSDLNIHLFQIDWWKVGSDKYVDIFEEVDDHAGEMESSVALALYPELVEMENAKNGETKSYSIDALNKGWVKTSRRFSKLNDHCAVGNPYKASADKGDKYIKLIVDRISKFLIDLSNTPIDKNFPFKRDKSNK